MRDNLGYSVDSTKTRLVQQTLKEAGYATGAGVSAFALRHTTGVAAGFDVFEDSIEHSPDTEMPDPQQVQRPGGETLRLIRPWLRAVADQPFFLFFHTFEPHTPYEPPPQYAERYEDPYDGEVAAADDVVGSLLEELRDLGVYDTALIVFLSDHGEDLGDHGEGEHGVFLYRSTLQVPLMIKLPNSQRSGETVTDPVQLIDVCPTLLSALGLPIGEEFEGTPLLSQKRPDPRANPIYAETFFPRLHFGWSDLAALIVDRDHFIDAPRPELYDLIEDPDEVNNLLDSKPDLGAELRQILTNYDRRLEEPEAVDAETRRKLEALGYVGAASTTEDEVLPDPKDRVHWMDDIQRAYQLYHDGELEAAVPAFQRILEENPNIEDVWGYLSLAQLELGRPEEAIATFFAALEQLPTSRRLSLRAASLLQHMGRLEEAAEYAERAVTYDPPAAHLILAQIAVKKGDFETAEREAQIAISAGNSQPEPRLILADVLIARGDARQAISLLRKTLDEGITDRVVHAKLAVACAWVGDFDGVEDALRGLGEIRDPNFCLTFGRLALSHQRSDEARRWFDRTLALDPDNPEAKLKLGLMALNEGRLTEAREFIQEAVAADLESFEGWSALGMVFARQGDPEGAIIAWERAHTIDPDFVEILFNLGVANAQLGRVAQAIAYLEDYLARAQPGPQRDQALAITQQLRARSSRGG